MTLAETIPEIQLGPQNLKWVAWPWPCAFESPYASTCYDQSTYQTSLYIHWLRKYGRRCKM